jgi:hypothetical protein
MGFSRLGFLTNNQKGLSLATTGPYTQAYPIAGTTLAVSWGDAVVRGINYYAGTPLTGDDERPYAVIRQTVAQALSSGASASILFDAEDIDTNNGHSTTTNTSRWTCPTGKPGWYSANWVGGFVSNATGDRLGWISISGGATRYAVNLGSAASGHQTYIGGSDRFFLNAGDYVQLSLEQYSGGSLNTDVALGGARLTIVQERMQ